MRKFFDDPGAPSDGGAIFEQSYNNISDERTAGADAFDIPESLWPMIQGREIIYKDFSELSLQEQREALRVGLKFIKLIDVFISKNAKL